MKGEPKAVKAKLAQLLCSPSASKDPGAGVLRQGTASGATGKRGSQNLRLNKKNQAATAVRDKGSLMVGALVDLHQSKLEKRLVPYKAAADLAREKKTVVALSRALIRKDPTLLRFGPRAVYNLAWAHHRWEPGQVLWDGRVSIWGIPIEPPRPVQP
jgi:hypothetical protein